MLRAPNRPVECVTAAHRGKIAYIYVRQSSVNQVRHPTALKLEWWPEMTGRLQIESVAGFIGIRTAGAD